MVKKAKKKKNAVKAPKKAKKTAKKAAKVTAKKAAKKAVKKAAKKAAKKTVKKAAKAVKATKAKKTTGKASAKAPAKKAAKPAAKGKKATKAKVKAKAPARAKKPRAPKTPVETPAAEAASAPEAPAASEPPAAAPRAGDAAPEFDVVGDQGEQISLSRLRGKKIVLYFYPKDDTPGCTVEACKFQEHLGSLTEHGAVVVGLSPDDAASHAKFRQKYNLTFHLGVDRGAEVAKRYGVWVEKNMYGKKSMGIQRSTFLIDADGNVAAAWPKVKVDGHAEEVLSALSHLS